MPSNEFERVWEVIHSMNQNITEMNLQLSNYMKECKEKDIQRELERKQRDGVINERFDLLEKGRSNPFHSPEKLETKPYDRDCVD